MSQETGFGDQVWYSDTRTNIYIYEVIGQTACPSTKPNCQDSEKVPLTVQYSGADQVSYVTAGGDMLEWYQPPWQYGNVLSYPGSYAQLQKIIPNIHKLSQDHTIATDSSTIVEKANWSSGTTVGESKSTQNNVSEEISTSVSSKVGVKDVSQGEFHVKVAVSGSVGISSLGKSLDKLGQSTGVGVKKPGTFLDPPNYGYFFTPYIFGQLKPPGTPDNPDPSQQTPDTHGSIRTAFVVDPLNNNAGGWWKQTYSGAPDVALNHPTRWNIENPPVTHPIPGHCRPVGGTNSQMNCATLAESFPTNPWVSPLHHMRGFFITTASDLNPGSGPSGPQLGSAEAGVKLDLYARVYNYSLKEIPAGTIVHVRFYGQQWNTHNQRSIGNSFPIEEAQLSPIPPFNTDDQLNWVLAKTTFDTTPYANQDLVFWVVVWMQDRNGHMVPELEGHGLTSIPGTLTSFADADGLMESQTVQGVKVSYSNNIGFYKWPFYVFPLATSPTASTASRDSQPPEVGGTPVPVTIGEVQVSALRVALGQAIEVSAALSGAGGRESYGTAVFYDGDPHAGGRVFDEERASYIAAGSSNLVKVLYRPTTCGVRKLYVVVGKGTSTETSNHSSPVGVPCRRGGVSDR